MPTRAHRPTSNSASSHHRPATAHDRPAVAAAAGAAFHLRDLVLDDVRTATRLGRLAGVTATELKTEIDRGYRAGRAMAR